ncbi:MAG: hypothetical protein JSV88_15380 [Candidatus Aminicenantes bacterium]|nr:MAG: hypothetical protein JSV88_15380 [Candidatus Aminicenantes bacterium]
MKPKSIVLMAVILSILIMFTTAVSDSTFATANQGVKEQKIPEGESDDRPSYTWRVCEVVMVGPDKGYIKLKLTEQDGSFINRWFTASEDQEKEILATGLTAMSSNFKVRACFDSLAEGGTIVSLFIQR